MTESEWLGCTEPTPMLEFLQGAGVIPDTWEVDHRRKWLLFCASHKKWLLARASFHRVHFDDDEETNQFIEQTERLVDGQGNYQQWWILARRTGSGMPVLVNRDAGNAILLRDIFGNPFRTISLTPDWRTPTVTSLATAAYDERILPSGELDPARLAVLSDALEAAGCDDSDILGHLRGPGPHVRGCWVIDLLLEKA